jgi:hypothetical protein
MASTENAHHAENHGNFVVNRSCFIAAGVALLFGIVWAMIGESGAKLAFVAIAFACFLWSGVRTEMSARALHADHH